MGDEISPISALLVFHSSDFPFASLLLLTLRNETTQRKEFFLLLLFMKYSWKWRHGNEAMGKGCDNCLSCQFPAVLVSSRLSL